MASFINPDPADIKRRVLAHLRTVAAGRYRRPQSVFRANILAGIAQDLAALRAEHPRRAHELIEHLIDIACWQATIRDPEPNISDPGKCVGFACTRAELALRRELREELLPRERLTYLPADDLVRHPDEHGADPAEHAGALDGLSPRARAALVEQHTDLNTTM